VNGLLADHLPQPVTHLSSPSPSQGILINKGDVHGVSFGRSGNRRSARRVVSTTDKGLLHKTHKSFFNCTKPQTDRRTK
jgi:hypothetical protein